MRFEISSKNMDIQLQTLINLSKLSSATKQGLIIELPRVEGFNFDRVFLKISQNIDVVVHQKDCEPFSARLSLPTYPALIEVLSKAERKPKMKPESSTSTSLSTLKSS